MVYDPNQKPLTYGESLRYLKGEEPLQEIPISGGGSSAVTPSQSTGTTGVAQTASALSTPTPDFGASIGMGTEGTAMDRLLSPVGEAVREGSSALREATGDFYDAAGPSRTFGSAEAKSDIDRYLKTGAGESDAQSILNAQYGGPEGLSYSGPSLRDTNARADALTSGSGLQALTHQTFQGLSPGEATFEAKSLLSDPTYLSQARESQSKLRDFAGELETEQTSADKFAQRREREEREIARRSGLYLSRLRGDMNDRFDTRAEEKNTANAQLERAFARLQENPNAANARLAGVEGDYRAIQDSPVMSSLRKAEAARDAINARYPDLEGVSVEKYTEADGREEEALVLDGKRYHLGEAMQGKGRPENMSADEWQALALRVAERQQALDDYFGAADMQYLATETHDPTAGAFAAYDPSYFQGIFEGQQYDIPGLENAFRFQPGEEAVAENVASQMEREKYNRLAGLLGVGDYLGEAEPYRAAEVESRAPEIAAKQERALQNREARLEDVVSQWRGHVDNQRSNYKDAKKDELVAKILGGVASAAAFPFLASVVGGAYTPGFAEISTPPIGEGSAI